VLIADPFETLVWAILGQQINVRFAATLKRRLVERYGERVHVNLPAGPRALLLFPKPEALATLSHDRDLRPLQFSRQKSAYTILAARAIADGWLDLEALRDAPPDEALERLMQLKGIGRWTAEYILMRGFGHPDTIPAADGGLRRVIGRAYGLGRLATEAEVRAIASRWCPWRSYAAFYWWFTLQLEARRGEEAPPAGAIRCGVGCGRAE
jgi:DNA-3-methyladenine glycosylase II